MPTTENDNSRKKEEAKSILGKMNDMIRGRNLPLLHNGARACELKGFTCKKILKIVNGVATVEVV